MSLVSMTGFAEAPGAHGNVRWRWEVKSVNGRGLDLRLRMPPGFDSVEPAARMLAGERFKRGNIQATLTVEPQESARGLRIDPAALVVGRAHREGDRGRNGAGAGARGRPSGAQGRHRAGRSHRPRCGRDAARAMRRSSKASPMRSMRWRKARRTEGAKLCHVLQGQVRDIAQSDGRSGQACRGPAGRVARTAHERSSRISWARCPSPKTAWRRKWRCWRRRPTCAKNSIV